MNKSGRRETRDVIVGVCVTAAVIVVLGLVFGPSPFAAGARYSVHASFEKTDGLEVGSPVHAAGVQVGEVSALELDEGYRVRATLSLDRDIELDTDATAAIVTDGLFGSKLVRIDIGGGDDIIDEDGTILFTEDALVLDDLFELIINQARASRAADGTEEQQ